MIHIDAVRSQFLALSTPDQKGQLPLFLDGPGGSQVPKVVVRALGDYLGCYNSNMGGFADAGVRTQTINTNARIAAATWLGSAPERIVFGQNSTSLMFYFARILARDWQAGDNIVLSSIDHYSNVSSWQSFADEKGVQVRTIPMQDGALTFDPSIIDARTRLVAVSLASNVLGTITDIAPIMASAQAVGAYVALDAVHAAVHMPIHADALGADLLFVSSYKLGGAHLGVAHLSPRMASLKPYKVAPASDIAPFCFETGTQSFEAQAALIALIDYWASLGGSTDSDMRIRLEKSYQAISAHEKSLTAHFLAQVAQREYIKLYGRQEVAGRTPTFAFNLYKDGKLLDGVAISKWCGVHNIALGAGNFYAQGIMAHLGISSVLRAGLMHYTTQIEIDRFFAVLDAYYQRQA